jgi:hypothetical protein
LNKKVSVEQDLIEGIICDTSSDFNEPKLGNGISKSEYRSVDLVFDYLIKLFSLEQPLQHFTPLKSHIKYCSTDIFLLINIGSPKASLIFSLRLSLTSSFSFYYSK